MRHPSAPVRLLRRALVVLSGTAVAGLVLAGPAAPPAAAQTTDSVTVNATSGLGTIPADGIGLNTAVYGGYMNDTPIPGLLKAAGVDALRYPGAPTPTSTTDRTAAPRRADTWHRTPASAAS